MLAALRKGEGNGGVFFYEHFSGYLCQDKDSPQHPKIERERHQAMPRDVLSQEPAGSSPSRSRHVGGRDTTRGPSLGPAGPHHKGMLKTSRHHLTPEDGCRSQSRRIVQGKDISPDLCSCLGVTNCPHVPGTERCPGMWDCQC